MKKPIEGHIACPICDHAEAEVKRDKNESLYIFCPECNAQFFTRGCARKQNAIRGKMRQFVRPETENTAVPEEKPEVPTSPQPPQPQPAKKRAGLLMD